MKCLNCGREYSNGERFCSVCGQNLVNNTSQIPSDNSFNQNIANGNVNFVNNNPVLDQESLLQIYVGVNYDNIKQKKWSWPAFFFTGPYLIYRKAWKMLGIYFAILLGCSLICTLLDLNILMSIISIAGMIVFGLKFNEWYLEYAKERINKIISQSSNSQVNIASIVKQKGGTNVAGAILICVPIMLIFMIAIFSSLFYSMLWPSIKEDICANAICNDDNTSCIYVSDDGYITRGLDCSDYK